MSDLASQQCSRLPAPDQALEQEKITAYLKQLDPRWNLNREDQTISYTYSFKNYYQTMAFVNVVAQVAHQQDHHPDMHVGYNRCTVTYSTHSVGGLSIKDFICAAKINTAQVL